MRTRLVCVDGPAGSGKTTFADRLVAGGTGRGLTVALVHMDDVFDGWDGLADAGRRVREQVVRAADAGASRRRTQRYDWEQERFAEQVTVPRDRPPGGRGRRVRRPGYADRISVLVWVVGPEELRLARGLDRDGAALEDRWRRWMVDEERAARPGPHRGACRRRSSTAARGAQPRPGADA